MTIDNNFILKHTISLSSSLLNDIEILRSTPLEKLKNLDQFWRRACLNLLKGCDGEATPLANRAEKLRLLAGDAELIKLAIQRPRPNRGVIADFIHILVAIVKGVLNYFDRRISSKTLYEKIQKEADHCYKSCAAERERLEKLEEQRWSDYLRTNSEKIVGDPKEANLFFLGDYHPEIWQRQFRADIINRYAQDGDIVLLEGKLSMQELQGADLSRVSQEEEFDAIKKKVRFFGWDLPFETNRRVDKVKVICLAEQLLSRIHRAIADSGRPFPDIPGFSGFCQELDSIFFNDYRFYDLHSFENFDRLRPPCYPGNTLEKRKLSMEKLDFLNKRLEKLKEEYLIISTVLRNQTMIETIKTIQEQFPGKKIFVIAGELHIENPHISYKALDFFKSEKCVYFEPKQKEEHTDEEAVNYAMNL